MGVDNRSIVSVVCAGAAVSEELQVKCRLE